MEKKVIIVGAGLAGLVAARELVNQGIHVTLVDQENEHNLGGQAWWSFGGLFLVDSPEQRRLGIRDSFELAKQDWFASAGFDRQEDEWGKKWAEAYVNFAAYEKRDWLKSLGISFFPVVGWAERGGYTSEGHGNSVPRFHIVWGTGPAIVEPFIRRMKEAEQQGLLTYLPRHQVNELLVDQGQVVGLKGSILEPSESKRGEESSRNVVDEFTLTGDAIIISSGGIGANFDLIRKNWPTRMGNPPETMIAGVPKYVDGRMLAISEEAGANLVNRDRMWHYTEGIKNWDAIWPHHGIRILPGPSSIWLDATGKRLLSPNFPGFDTLGTLEALRQTGYDYSWFILTQKIIEKEFALSGSEQNPDLTGKSLKLVLKRILPGPTAPVQAFLDHGEDFIIADNVETLVHGMNTLIGENRVDPTEVLRQLEARDREMDHKFTKDLQITALRGARNYIGDKLIRVAKPHKVLDPSNGPLIAVRLHIVSRKTLGGLQTDLSGRVLDTKGDVLSGLYAAGEVSGFGGGGVHGYRALEGTFLGGCLFSGRQAGRGVANDLQEK